MIWTAWDRKEFGSHPPQPSQSELGEYGALARGVGTLALGYLFKGCLSIPRRCTRMVIRHTYRMLEPETPLIDKGKVDIV